MRRMSLVASLVILPVVCWGGVLPQAYLPGASGGLSPGQQCRAAIGRAERLYALPAHLLGAIGRVESGRAGPDGRVDPWPYSINAEGVDHIFESKTEAVAAVRALQAGGMRSIDVGCLQINLLHHPDAFGSLEEAFDPWRNADYAARFLLRLRAQSPSWDEATADYHSATPELGGPYAAKVKAALTVEAGMPAATFGSLQPAVVRSWPAGAFGAVHGLSAGIASPMGRILRMEGSPLPGAAVLGGIGSAGGLVSGASGRGLMAYRANPVRLLMLPKRP